MDGIALDKTGTLTEGAFQLLGLRVCERATCSERDLWEVLVAVEKWSNHPVALAVCAAAVKAGVAAKTDAHNFENLNGEGVSAVVGSKHVYIGSRRLLQRLGYTRALDDDRAALHREV